MVGIFVAKNYPKKLAIFFLLPQKIWHIDKSYSTSCTREHKEMRTDMGHPVNINIQKLLLPGVWFPEFIVIPPWPLMPWRPKALSPVRNQNILRGKKAFLIKSTRVTSIIFFLFLSHIKVILPNFSWIKKTKIAVNI